MKPMLWPLLGVARFLLALIVAGAHLTKFHPQSIIGRTCFGYCGFVAVLGFLVISGFSIAASYEKRKDGFYGRRALRILPLYVLSIAFAVFVSINFGAGTPYAFPGWSVAIQNLFLLQGFTVGPLLANAVVWTLSIEVLFYLLTPLLARLSTLALIAITSVSALLFVADSYLATPYYSYMEHGAAAAVLAWSWLLGFILHRLKNSALAAVITAGVVITLLNITEKGLTHQWTVPVAVTVVCIGLGGTLRAPAWVARVAELLGDASYPLYLFHLPLYVLLAGVHGPVATWPWVVGAIALSIFLDRCFDQPFKKLVHHFASHQAQPLTRPVVELGVPK